MNDSDGKYRILYEKTFKRDKEKTHMELGARLIYFIECFMVHFTQKY